MNSCERGADIDMAVTGKSLLQMIAIIIVIIVRIAMISISMTDKYVIIFILRYYLLSMNSFLDIRVIILII